MLAASAIFSFGVGQAAWTFFPIDRQASGFFVAASKNSTCPLRNEIRAWSCLALKHSMCGRRTGFLVASSQNLPRSPEKSIVWVGLAVDGFADNCAPS